MSNYLEFRGKCKELSEALIKEDPTLRLVRGYYHCPVWGKQAHWWCCDQNGKILDPSVKQFPTQGAIATYEEYDGNIECEYCNKVVPEEEAYWVEHHAYCSGECYMHDVGF